MKLAYLLSGGAAHNKRYKIGVASLTTAGVPILVASAGAAGVVAGTTTACNDAVGVSLDTATYSATQGDAEGLITVTINPDAVWRIPLAGSATSGAALVVTRNSAASAAGTVVTITTGDPAPNSPDMDEGTAWCVSGANVGQTRKITSTAATTATVTVPFLNDLTTSDIFILMPPAPAPDVDLSSKYIQLTTLLDQADISATWDNDAEIRMVELELDAFGTFPTSTTYSSNSNVLGLLDDHVLHTNT